jgi:hypothetical protein
VCIYIYILCFGGRGGGGQYVHALIATNYRTYLIITTMPFLFASPDLLHSSPSRYAWHGRAMSSFSPTFPREAGIMGFECKQTAERHKSTFHWEIGAKDDDEGGCVCGRVESSSGSQPTPDANLCQGNGPVGSPVEDIYYLLGSCGMWPNNRDDDMAWAKVP